MVVTDLGREQVIQLHQHDGRLVAEHIPVELWLWQYGDVLRHLFEIPPLQPEVQEEQITHDITQIKNIPSEEQSSELKRKLFKLELKLEKVQKSRAFIDVIYAEQQKLRNKESELSQLIKKISQQQSKD
jgi:hypothetical protein